MTLTGTQIATNDYADILFDTTNHAADIASYGATLAVNSSSASQALIANAIATSPEVGIVNYVYSLYSTVLGVQLNNTTMPGVKYWVQAAEQQMTPTQIVAGTLTDAVISFLDQSFINVAGSNLPTGSPTTLVDLLYSQALNVSNPLQAGVDYWVNQYNVWISSTGATHALVALVNSFANAAAVNNAPLIGGLLSAGAQTDTSAGLGTGATYGTLATATPLASGPSVALTTATDKIIVTANNTTITGTGGGTTTGTTGGTGGTSGTGATFTAGDSINGGNYTGNSLSVWDLATAPGANWTPTTITATVTNIQTVNFTSAEAVTASTTKGYTGLTTLNISSTSDGSAVDSVTVGNGTAVNVTDTTALKPVSANLTVTGGSTVSITEANGSFANAGKTITVTGGSGTTGVSVTQTESARGCDQLVSITDANESGGSAFGTITAVTLDGLDGATSGTVVATIADSALATLTVNNARSGVVAITEGAYASPATTLNLAVNNDTFTLNDTGSKYTTLAITAGAGGASLTEGAGFTAVTSETVGGSGVLTQTAAVMRALKTITVTGSAGLVDSDLAGLPALTSVSSTSSGVVAVSLNAGLTSFTGGAGQDIVTIGLAASHPITGGSASNNEIVLNGAATLWPTLTNITNFSVLGVGPASTGIFDLHTLAGFNAIDAQAGVGTVAFTNVTASTTLAIDGNAASISYATADSNGTHDSVQVTIGGSASNSNGDTIGSLSLTDAAGTGIDSVTITGYDTTAGAGHIVTTLVDNSLSSLTINGSACENIGAFGFTDLAATLLITNNSSSIAASTIKITAPALSSLNFAGSGITSVFLTDTFAGTFTLTDTAAGAVTVLPSALPNISSLTVNDSGSGPLSIGIATDVALTDLTINNTGTGRFNEATLIADNLSQITLTGSGPSTVALSVTNAGGLNLIDTDTGTVTVSLASTLSTLGVADNGGNFVLASGSISTAATINLINIGSGTITVAGLADDQASTVVLGGAVSLTLTDALAGPVSILGGGDNSSVTVNLNHNAAGASNINLGNGNDTVIISDGVLNNAVTIMIGSGNNSISLLPGHTGSSVIMFTAANGASSSSLTTVVNATAGDTIVFTGSAVGATVTHEGLVGSVAAGLAGVGATGYSDFIYGGETYIYENTGNAATNELVAIVGTHTIAAAAAMPAAVTLS